MAVESLGKVIEEIAKNASKEYVKTTVDLDLRIRQEMVSSKSESLTSKARSNEKVNIDKRLPQEKAKDKVASFNTEKNLGEPLTDIQKNELMSKGFSSGILDKTTYSEGVYRINTGYDNLAGQKHPDTKVPYKSKVVDVLGEKMEGVFPEFDAKLNVQLPENLINAGDKAQFKFCNKCLQEAVARDPGLKNQFNKTQLAQIEGGNTPRGFTWHHNEERGIMQLVETVPHGKTPHIGGKAIWGGGSKAR